MNQTQLWKQYPAIRLLLLQLTGYETYLRLPLELSALALLPLIPICWWAVVRKRVPRKKIIPNLVLVVGAICVFNIYARHHDQSLRSNHFENRQSEARSLRVQITDIRKSEFSNWISCEADVSEYEDSSSNWFKSCGRLIVHLNSNKDVLPGDALIIPNDLQSLRPIKYSSYNGYIRLLNARQFYHEVWLNTNQPVEREAGLHLKRWAYVFRNQLSKMLDETHCNAMTRSMMKSILLGDRNQLEPGIKNQFKDTGTLHVLAISGLHTGVIYGLLSYIFSLIPQRIRGIWDRILIIVCLWGFALITGLSSSVCRSALMFSFFALAGMMGRKGSSMNSWGIAAIILLLMNPYWYRELGFQFSFIAVAGILIWFKPLQKRFKVNGLFWKWVRDLLLLSLCAQTVVSSLSMYYFHQFPIYFLLSNLLVVPAVSVVLISSMLLIIFSRSGIHSIITTLELIADSYVFWMDYITFQISRLPMSSVYVNIDGTSGWILQISMLIIITNLAFPGLVHKNLLASGFFTAMYTCTKML